MEWLFPSAGPTILAAIVWLIVIAIGVILGIVLGAKTKNAYEQIMSLLFFPFFLVVIVAVVINLTSGGLQGTKVDTSASAQEVAAAYGLTSGETYPALLGTPDSISVRIGIMLDGPTGASTEALSFALADPRIHFDVQPVSQPTVTVYVNNESTTGLLKTTHEPTCRDVMVNLWPIKSCTYASTAALTPEANRTGLSNFLTFGPYLDQVQIVLNEDQFQSIVSGSA